MGIWDRLKQVIDGVAPKTSEWPPEQSPEPPAQAVPQGPAAGESDPLQGYSEIWASELIDGDTCKNCASHDGHEYTSMADARADYPEGEYPASGYKHCTSDSGCRGTLMMIRSG
ncbi:hypothetical protein [Arthrobacter oryzae]|uniref:Uncharacterized protein n=1 Tax=Arthrobacter oryzae TaxID=409290 RepID=A0A495FKM5_9MICC|nr:hypothetical protein [Arthrobacter oryzae]RKR29798.1 hypothetical protein C8D78_0113 [Arthrobacter oryzae]